MSRVLKRSALRSSIASWRVEAFFFLNECTHFEFLTLNSGHVKYTFEVRIRSIG